MSSPAVLRRFVGTAAALLLAAGTSMAGVGNAAAADQDQPLTTGAECGPGAGVTVVVDFSANGINGGLAVGCAPGAQADLLGALSAAGFDYTVEAGPSGPVLCSIAGVGAAAGDCAGSPYVWSGYLRSGNEFVSSWEPVDNWSEPEFAVDGYIGLALTENVMPRFSLAAPDAGGQPPDNAGTDAVPAESGGTGVPEPAEGGYEPPTDPDFEPTVAAGNGAGACELAGGPAEGCVDVTFGTDLAEQPATALGIQGEETGSEASVVPAAPSSVRVVESAPGSGLANASATPTTAGTAAGETSQLGAGGPSPSASAVPPSAVPPSAVAANAVPTVQSLSETGVTDRVVPFSLISAGMMLVGALILVLAKPRQNRRHL